MLKRLSKLGNSQGIIIEKPILDLLGITAETSLDLTVTSEGGLLIRPLKAVGHAASHGDVWDELTEFGLPLKSQVQTTKSPLTMKRLVDLTQRALTEIYDHGTEERNKEALLAYLLAIKTHYPSIYKLYFSGIRRIRKTDKEALTGRIVKLYRISRENVSRCF